jgi:hypothetical protein
LPEIFANLIDIFTFVVIFDDFIYVPDKFLPAPQFANQIAGIEK